MPILSPAWTLTSPTVTLLDGSVIEGESAVLYLAADSTPQILQIKAKAVVSVPWGQIRSISHD